MKSDKVEDSLPEEFGKYQKLNLILSILILGFIILFSYLVNFPMLILFSLLILIVISYYEQKANFCPKKYSKYIFLINSTGIFATIVFWFVPLPLNIQFIIMIIGLYLILEIFATRGYFVKENVLIAQHVLAVSSFIAIIYSFFDIFSFIYIDFTTDPILIIFSKFLLHTLTILSLTLVSFYYLYVRHFRKHPWDNFNRCMMILVLLLELTSYIVINLRNYISLNLLLFSNGLILSTILFPGIFLIFTFINYLIGVFSSRTTLSYSYYSCWGLMLTIGLSIMFIFVSNLTIVISILLFFSISSYYLLKFGQKIEKISESSIVKFTRINSYFIFIELFFLLFSIFFDLFSYFALNDKIIISAYASFIGITFLNNIILKKKLISESNRVVINELSLIFTSVLIFYYSFIYFFGSFLVLVFPFLISSISFYLPFKYILTKTTHQPFIKSLIKLNSIVLCASFLLIPTVFSLQLVLLGYDFNAFNVVNFTLYIFYGILVFIQNLSRQLKIRENRKELIVKLQIIIGFIVTGTTMFYYPYVLFKDTSYLIIFPLLSASSFLFIPLIFSYKKECFNTKLVKKIIILNSILFWSIIIFIPCMIGLEIVRLGMTADPILITLFSVILFFISLKFFDQISSYIELKEGMINNIKIIQPITWLFISILISLIFFNLNLIITITWLRNVIFASAILLFFIFNSYNLVLLEDLKQSVFEDETSKLDYYKIYKIYEFNKNIIIFGVNISLSLLFMSIVQVINYNQFFIDNDLQLLGFTLDIAIFLLILLLALNVSDKLIKIDFERVKVSSELIIWIILKSIILFTLALYPIQLSFFNKIVLLILVFAVLSPISHYYLERKFLLLENTQLAIRKSIRGLFFLSTICFSTEIIWNISSIILVPYFNQELLLILVFGKIFLFSNYYLLQYNVFTERESGFHIYKLYGISLVLLISYLFPISIVFLIPFMIVLLQRNKNSYFRLFFYLILSVVTFIEATGFLVIYEHLPSLEALSISMSSIIYLISLISVFFTSIILNLKRENNIEKFILYFLISLLSFILLAPYIYLIYNTTTSLFIFLCLMGIFYYRKEEKRYKWFIKPCVLLAIFDFISFLSFSFFFNDTIFAPYNPILSFTLTLSVSGFAFVFLYNDSPRLFRKRSFYAVLASNIISFPVFLYFFLISVYSLPLFDLIILIISINVGVVLFYLSIAIYQWKLSWAIWKVGYRMWIIFPIINYALISEAFTGIDVFTNALNLFGVNLYGSNLLALILCVIISLPFWYSWIKKHFTNVLFISWGLCLFLIYWFSQNAFFGNPGLSYLSFIGISVIILMPILVRLRSWNIVSILWIIFSTILLIFLFSLFEAVGFLIELNYPIITIVCGLLFITLSFFPNLKAQKNVILILAYSIALTGIFLLIFHLIFLLTLDPYISTNIALIIMSFSLFSSRLLKLKHTIFNRLISTILIVNFSSLTYFTFSLVPDFGLFPLFLAVSVFGGSYFVFNYYKLFFPSKKIIPLSILSFGISSSFSSFIFLLFPDLLFIVAAVFITINLFLINFSLGNYRFIMWYLIPIPFTLFILQFLFYIELFQPLFLFTLAGLILYTLIFQIFINLFNSEIEIPIDSKSYNIMKFFEDKNQIKVLNLICFLLNSTYFSVFITFISPFNIFYQILEFLILWSILTLLSIRYAESSKIEIDIEKFTMYLKKFSSVVAFLLYIEISFFVFGIALDYLGLGLIENVLLSLSCLFILTFFDFYFIKKVSKKIIYPIHIFTYILISIFTFILLNQFLTIGLESLFLSLSILLIMQFYTEYAIFTYLNLLGRYDASKLNESMIQIRNVLINLVIFTIGFYTSSLITSLLISSNKIFIGFPALFFFLMILSFIMFVINLLIKFKFRQLILWGSFLTFQVCFTAFYGLSILLFTNFNIFNSMFLVLVNTLLAFYSVFSIKRIFKDKVNAKTIQNSYSILMVLSYLETSILFYGLFNLSFGLIESFLASQIVLFFISIVEINIVKKIKSKYMFIVHTISYFNISWSVFSLIFFLSPANLALISLATLVFALMQFYTNYSYYNTMRNFNRDNEESLLKWKTHRKNFIGGLFYIVLSNYIFQTLYLTNIELLLIFFLSSILIHVLMIFDRFILKFLGKYSVYLMTVSWAFIFGFSFIYFLGWIPQYSISIVPIIIIILLLELVYGYALNLFDFWGLIKENKLKFRNFLIIVSYINFCSWPLYYLTLDILNITTMILIVFGILLFLTLLDNDSNLNSINQKTRKQVNHFSLIGFGVFASFNVYFALDVMAQTSFLLNISTSILVFMVFVGFLVKPFKKRKLLSFAYWASMVTLISTIFYTFYTSGWSWSLLIVGVLLYPFIFMLEELKEFFDKIVDNLSALYQIVKNAINSLVQGVIKFLRVNFKVIRIILCLSLGIFTGILFSDLVWQRLNPFHSILLALAIFGLSYGIIPSQKSEDLDEIFREKMKKFIILWISVTAFILVLIIPFMEPLFTLFLVILSILGLGAILLLFIYRLEERERVSIKWRFYTLIFFFILLGIEILIVVLLYVFE
ncbi:MAG: hypothetical protein CEE42_09440 [Promethearchaeota archaeon Loki_b31]|nr:MAG: hypothetical protein CEE42_09440 [Candidatus Lokiarchaeota archaeon Loki_b31]